jgi:hypothetical protein
MALTKRSENNIIYLEVKHNCLWRQLKKRVEGCAEIEVTNPRTGETLTKYGHQFDTVTGHAVKLVKYDTEKKYSTRYFGFKLHLTEGDETYVLDLPYQSTILRRFLRAAPNFDWSLPLSITIFKGAKKNGSDKEGPVGVWFQQRGETVKPYYTREQPHDMPIATYDDHTQEWDFKAQHRWLVDKLQSVTIPDIEGAARVLAEPVSAHEFEEAEHGGQEEIPKSPNDYIDDDDVPF